LVGLFVVDYYFVIGIGISWKHQHSHYLTSPISKKNKAFA